MNKFLKNLIYGVFAIIGTSGFLHAESTFGQASDIFNIGAGARTMAMGSAFTGLADDASAPYYNPAGLALLDEHQLMAMHAPLFLDSHYNYLASVHPFGDKYGSIGISDALLVSDKFELRDTFNRVTDSNGKFTNNAIFASYAHKLPMYLSGGVNVKFIQQKVASFDDSALGLDLGFLYKQHPLISVGLMLSNINSPKVKLDTANDTFNPVVRLGLASRVYKERLILTADFIKVQDEDMTYGAGTEYKPHDLISFRAGYNANRSYTFGVGINIKPFKVDYAFSDTDLGSFNKVSVIWAWHNIYKTDVVPPIKNGRPVHALEGFKNMVAFKTNVPDHVVSRWTLSIKNAMGEMVRTLEGDLRPPETIEWDARNQVGEPVVQGRYDYEFVVKYKNGKVWNVKGDVNLDLPNHKIEEVIDMNLELNGSQGGEEDLE